MRICNTIAVFQALLRVLALLVLPACLAAEPGDSTAVAGLDLTTGQEWFTEGAAVIQLPAFPLDPTSLEIRSGSRRLEPGVDYLVEAHSGRIRLLSTRDQGASLHLRWQVLRVTLPGPMHLRTELELPWIGPETGPADTVYTPAAERVEDSGTLRYSGSFLRAIRVGGGSGVGLESGLRLQVEGQLGSNVDVEAFLSDQSTPLVPEGRSESLEEIDRIHVSVRSPHWHTLMGDFDLELANRHFLDYRRTVDGIEGGWRSGASALRGWAALARGRTRRMELAGQEGVQGPWQLLSEQGREDIIVLAGSERVWLDGVPVARGEDRDYTIDYSLGQVHFTARRPITADTRITVEYQYSERVYNRSLLGATGSATNGALTVSVAAVSERDDPDNPLDQFLGDDDRRLLAAAGDSPEGYLGSGIRETDPGEGSYRFLAAEGQWGHYEFAEDPPDSLAGDFRWELRFTELGRDSQGQWRGDYERRFTTSGRPWWSFVGSHQGAWAPVVPLAAPKQLELVDLQARWARGRVDVELESAVSREDLNLFSGLDDSDNLGSAVRLKTGLRGRDTAFGRPRLGVSVGGEQAGFRTFAPTDEVEYERTWGLARTGTEDLVRVDLETALEAGDSLFQRVTASLLDRGSRSSRLLAVQNRIPLGRHTRLDHHGRWRRLGEQDSRSRWHQVLGSAEQDLGRTTVRLGLDTESRSSLKEAAAASGDRHTEWQLGARRPLGPHLELLVDGSRRERQALAGGWIDRSITDASRLRLRLAPASGWTGETDWSHRETRWAAGDSADTVTDLALLDLRRQTRHLEASVLYRVENSLVQDRLTQFVRVDSLQGDYSPDPFNPGIFVPDPDGSWVAFSVDTGARRRVSAVTLESSLRYTHPALPGVSGDTRIEVEGRGPVAHPIDLYRLSPAVVLGDSILSGAIRVRQDLEFEDRGGRKWRFRLNEEHDRDRRLLQNPLERLRRETSLRCRLSPGSVTRLSLEARRRSQNVRYLQTPSADREVLAHGLEGEVVRDLRRDLQLRTTLRWDKGTERRLDLAAALVRLDPRLEWRRNSQSTFSVDGSWQFCWASGERIPYELLEGARVGRTVRAGAEVRQRMGKQTSFSLSWRMDRLPDREAVHSGRAQIQSFF